MIWTLRIECEWGRYLEEECVKEVELDSGTPLLELHEIIQDAVNFGNDHLFEFFAGRHARNRKVEFVAMDSYDWDWEANSNNYSKIALDQVYPLPKGCQLFYHFDFGDDWYFKIKKSRKKPRDPEPDVQYPQIVKSIGPNPSQYGSWEEEDL